MERFSLQDFPLQKTVLVRVDYNVPLANGKVQDNTKIKSSLNTIQFLLDKKCKVVLMSHFGRPDGKVVDQFRLKPIARELQKLLPRYKIVQLNDCIGPEIKRRIVRGKSREIFMLENLRFYQEEEENDAAFAHSLADLADLYVNDAFAVCHRPHASVEAIVRFIPAVAGFLVEKEIQELNKALRPEKPLVWILGGAKLDKIDLLHQALNKADYILIGGALSFSFLRAAGFSVGLSKIDTPSVRVAKKILKKKSALNKIILPVDFVVAEKLSPQAKTEIVAYNNIRTGQIALDLGPETVKKFKTYLYRARTIVWNGPLGYFEWAKFANSTKEIGRFIGKLTATTIVGGGETAEAMRKFRLDHNLTHLSTGGGASLAFLSGKHLPGLDALIKNYHLFNKRF